MADLRPFKSGLGGVEPVALTNENVCIVYGTDLYYRKIAWLESLPPFQVLDMGAIAAQATSGKVPAANLAFPTEEFAQIRWFVIDNVQARLWLPEADGKYRTRAMMAYIDMNTIERDPDLHLTEFFIWEDNVPVFEALNGMDYALTQCRVIGMGYRFKVANLDAVTIDAIRAGQKPCTYCYASGRT